MTDGSVAEAAISLMFCMIILGFAGILGLAALAMVSLSATFLVAGVVLLVDWIKSRTRWF